MAERIVFWGAGGHARVIADLVQAAGEFELAGVLDNTTSPPAAFCAIPVSTSLDDLDRWREAGVRFAVAAVGDNSARVQMGQELISRGFELPRLVHPSAIVSDSACVGSGAVIGARAVVGPGCQLADHVLINSGAIVEHDCRLSTGAAIGPGATLGGGCSIGAAAWVGIGATLSHDISVGDQTIIGAGAVVVESLKDRVVAYGVPAKPMRDRDPDERVV